MDHPDYKYQPRRKKMKTMCGMNDAITEDDEEKQQSQSQISMPHTTKKSGRRTKKHHVETEENDNDSDKISNYATSCMNYAASYENRAPGISNYSTFPSNFLSNPTAISSQETISSYQSNYNNYYASTAVARKHEQLLQSKFVDSPHSSIDEHQQQQTPPESNVICSTPSSSSNALATRSITPTSSTGTLRELSPSLITAHTVAKEDHMINECAYRNMANISEPNNKDFNLISKYNQESYRVYSTQLHHHHHYHHYAIGTPTQQISNGPSSNGSGGSGNGGGSLINYGNSGYHAYPNAIDDVDVDEMEQYLDNEKYNRKFCYLKPENSSSLTELSPISSSSTTNVAHHSLAHNHDNENLTHIPTIDPIIASQQPIDVTPYAHYQNQVPSATAVSSNATTYPYIGNWVNYSI
ncbi:hypothetical protein PVAND_000710 [Polypedilum vanderplanki]|uniref:Uncharacterized protein n=1 Tax=Polypedilum vanderplanki TaxID=319348 RepID=A0A9J6BM39_POLVA|nr:hypothetical protein PVAND_000710 [Polypedilum vanderplanki]